MMMEKDNGKQAVFEVPTDYPTHPGGQEALNSARTHSYKDILFLTSHMALDLDGRIAQAAEAKGIALPPRGPVYNELHAALRRIIQEHPHEVTVYRAWCLFLTILFPLSVIGFNVTASPWWAAALGFVNISYSFNIFHMRNHRGGIVYGIDWLDRWTRPFYDFLERTYAIRPENWRQHHNESHHLVTNDPDEDYDVLNPFEAGMRLHPSLPYHPIHQFQPIYIPILLSLNGMFFWVDNLFRYGGHPIYAVIYWLTMFILPTYTHGWKALQTELVTFLGASLFISYLFQVSHNHGDLASFNGTSKKPVATTKGNAVPGIDEFIRLQLNETMSWGGYWSCLLFGGINYQIEHHIVPTVPSPLFYHYLSPHLQELAQRQGWNYVYEPNFCSAVAAYHEHLCRMSLPPVSSSAKKLQ